MTRQNTRTLWGLLPLLSTLFSCASFYNVPPGDIGFVDDAGQIQIAGQLGEKGKSVIASFGIHDASRLHFRNALKLVTKEEADSLVERGSSVVEYAPTLFGLVQAYDHPKSSSDSTDLRAQREYNIGLGSSAALYRLNSEGRSPLFGWLGDLHLASALCIGYGSIDSEYERWSLSGKTFHKVEATYLRPALQGHFTLSRNIVDGLTIEVGSGGRFGYPFFLKSTRTDTSLAGSALQIEFSLFARILLFDFIAVEWQKAADSNLMALLLSSDWYYEYEVFGLRLLL